MFSVFENDWNLQDRLALIGWHYDLPMVSMKDALVEQFGKAKNEIVSKQQYFHEQDLRRAPLIGNDYVNVKLLDRKNVDQLARIDTGSFRHNDTDLQKSEMDDQEYGTPLFPNNWMHTPGKTENRNSFKLHLRCKRLILIFKDSGSEQFGIAIIKVDGEFTKKS